ncbi:MAG: CinA family protein [Planktomarina sp.]
MNAADILKIATARGLRITTAESCTGGMVAAALTDLAGSSAMFEFGFVAYSNAAKIQLLDVQMNTLDQFGAVSEQVAAEMAKGAKTATNADIAVSISGIAGPGGSNFKPEGRVCFGLTTVSGTITQTVEFGAIGRENVRIAAKDHALGLILMNLENDG